MRYDNKQKQILDSLESGKLKLNKASKAEINSVKPVAKNTFKKDKRGTIRLYQHDFSSSQKKTLEMGIPYQTLISCLIHCCIFRLRQDA